MPNKVNNKLPVYDFRKDVKNVYISPEIRCRFMRLEPGTKMQGHSHDLAPEVFLMLQGTAIFDFAGRNAELGPGQMCVTEIDEVHTIEVTSKEPAIMYLSVSPHIQPTHTGWTEDGKKKPHRFVPSANYDVVTDTKTPLPQLTDKVVAAVRDFAAAAQAAAKTETTCGEALKKAAAAGDMAAMAAARSDMWDALAPLYKKMSSLASTWNDLAPRAGPTS